MQTPLTVKRWSRVEYERLVDRGAFDQDPIELIGGQLIVTEPKGTYHVTVVTIMNDVLRRILPPGWIVRSEAPISLDDESAPEPDLVIVPGTYEDYLNAHPSIPALVIEVADTSLGFDRRIKGSVYARGGVQDYWIVNVTDRVLEVYRDPQVDPAAAWGWSYRSVRTVRPTESVTPLALPSTPIPVAALLPRPRA
ncbi:MAG: Uma2 family endonuclease [Actinobacteria bacterium]|nr:Uma2 family endonuclease [Actinomycetota bacterium]